MHDNETLAFKADNLGHDAFLADTATDSELSVSMKHVDIFRQIVERELPYALVIEDDVQMADGIGDRLADLVQQLDSFGAWGVLCVGSSGGTCADIPDCVAHNKQRAAVAAKQSKPPNVQPNIYRKQWTGGDTPPFKVTVGNLMRMADAYVISLACARALLPRMLPLAFPIDLQLNFILNDVALKERQRTRNWKAGAGPSHAGAVYWAEPPLARQTTRTSGGAITSSSITRASAMGADRAAVLQQALVLRPVGQNAERTMDDLGNVLMKLQRKEEGVAMLAAALEVNPRRFVTLANVGIFEFQAKKYSEAAHHLERAAAIRPTNANINRDLGAARRELSLQKARAKLKADEEL